MDKAVDSNVDELEKQAKFTIIQMDDEQDDTRRAKILDDAKTEMTRLYEEFRSWLEENLYSEDINDRFEHLKLETARLLKRTKRALLEFNQREDVIKSKAKMVQAGGVIRHCFDEGIQEIMSYEYVAKAVDNVSTALDNVRHDERVRQGVKSVKRGTLQIAQSAFDGIKRVLDTDDDVEDKPQKGSEL